MNKDIKKDVDDENQGEDDGIGTMITLTWWKCKNDKTNDDDDDDDDDIGEVDQGRAARQWAGQQDQDSEHQPQVRQAPTIQDKFDQASEKLRKCNGILKK